MKIATRETRQTALIEIACVIKTAYNHPYRPNLHKSNISQKRSTTMAKIVDIEGIGPVYGAKLQEAGITTTDALLKATATPADRKDLATATDIDSTLILKWANRADLFRIKGVGEEYSDLLEASGVDTVPELAQRNAENLYNKMLEVNAEKKLVRRPPSQNAVSDWVAQAKDLPRALFY